MIWRRKRGASKDQVTYTETHSVELHSNLAQKGVSEALGGAAIAGPPSRDARGSVVGPGSARLGTGSASARNSDAVFEPHSAWSAEAEALLAANASVRPYKVPRSYRVRADLFSARPIVIQGELEGRELVAGTVVLLPGGTLRGDVRVATLLAAGLLDGDIKATERVEAASQAEVCGSVASPIMRVAAGATINGAKLIVEDRRR